MPDVVLTEEMFETIIKSKTNKACKRYQKAKNPTPQ